jgi:hypothetical protein
MKKRKTTVDAIKKVKYYSILLEGTPEYSLGETMYVAPSSSIQPIWNLQSLNI